MKDPAIESSAGKLPVHTKFAYGLGSVAFGIKDHGFSALLMLYYNQVIGLPASWVGTAIMLAMVVDAFVDPMIGHYSDNLRSRWGRRHPFMFASALPVAVFYFLLWAPPQAGQGLQFAYLVCIATMVRVSISFFEIPNAALMNEFTTGYDERTSLATYRTMLFTVGLVGMAVVTFKYLLPPGESGQVGQLNPAGYIGYSYVAAVIMLVCILLSSWGTYQRIGSLAQADHSERVSLTGLWDGLKSIVLDRTYSSVLLCCFFFAAATGINTALGTYFSTYFWRLSSDQIGTVSGAALCGMLLAVPVLALTKKFSKKQVTMALLGLSIFSSTGLIAAVLVKGLNLDIPRLMPLLVAQNILGVMCVLAALILLMSMVADVGEHFQLKTGKRMEGLMFAALIMINKAVSGIGVMGSGFILSAIHFPEKAKPGQVDVQVIHQLGWIYVVCMTLLCLLAIICLSFYPITREAHRRMVERLKEI